MQVRSRPVELGCAESVLPHGLKRWHAPEGPKRLRAAGYWLLALIIPAALIGEVLSPDAPRSPQFGPQFGSTAQLVREFIETPPPPTEVVTAIAGTPKSARPSVPNQAVPPVAAEQLSSIEMTSTPAFDDVAAVQLGVPGDTDALPHPHPPPIDTGYSAGRTDRNAPQAPRAPQPVAGNDGITPRPADPGARPRISDDLSAPVGIARSREDTLPPRAAETRPALSAASDLATPEAGPRDDLARNQRRPSSIPKFQESVRGQLSPGRAPLPTVSTAPDNGLVALNGPASVMTGTRVAIHVPIGTDRAFAQAVTRFIVNDGLDVFTVRNFRFGLDRPNIRFFHASDRAVAERVARVLTAYGLPAEARDFTHYRPPPEPGLIEVWIAPPSRFGR